MGVKILVAEDDKINLAVIRQSLIGLGYDVATVADGVAAWKYLESQPVRVIVSDWAMPRLSGLELCRRVRSRTQGDYIYFILLTGKDANEANRREAMDAGVDDFLTKPLDPNELQARLHVAERILRYTTQVRQLEGMLPICTCCKKIRDDQNYWQQIETYINERTGTEFSHAICPDCYERVMVPQINALKSAASNASKNPPA